MRADWLAVAEFNVIRQERRARVLFNLSFLQNRLLSRRVTGSFPLRVDRISCARFVSRPSLPRIVWSINNFDLKTYKSKQLYKCYFTRRINTEKSCSIYVTIWWYSTFFFLFVTRKINTGKFSSISYNLVIRYVFFFYSMSMRGKTFCELFLQRKRNGEEIRYMYRDMQGRCRRVRREGEIVGA